MASRDNDDMFDDERDTKRSKRRSKDRNADIDKSGGAGTIAALIGVVYLALLILMNTSRVDVNVVVYTFEDTPLWWFTVLVVVITLVADRLVRLALRRSRRKRD